MNGTAWAGTVIWLVALASLALGAPAHGRSSDKTSGAIRFIAASRVEKSAGVWVDGKYLGYIGQFTGRKSLTVAPGKHQVVLRETGYKEITRDVTIAAGGLLDMSVSMEIDPRMKYSAESGEVRIHISPNNAAVYLDGAFAGTANDFGGIGRSMLAPTGKHTIKISLPGYQDYVVPIEVEAGEKYSIEMKLTPGTGTQQGSAIRQ